MSSRSELFKFVDSTQASALQRSLASKVVSKDIPRRNLRLVAGFDSAYEKELAFTVASVYDLEKSAIIETVEIVETVPHRYMPGFLGFREGPLIVKIAARLKAKPDAYLIDGHGMSHPRGFGIACHVGLALDAPTVGVAKSLLYGKVADGKIVKTDGRTIGRILIGSTGKKFFVSVGHKISLQTAVRTVKRSMLNGHPAPLRSAHSDSIRLKEQTRHETC